MAEKFRYPKKIYANGGSLVIVLPSLVKKFGWDAGTEVVVEVDPEGIVIVKKRGE